MNETIQSLVDFAKLAFIIFLTIHWISCIFFAIGLSESGLQEESWISKNFDITPDGIMLETWEYYLSTMYFALLTMATIGYGDIVPVTELEMIFVMLVLFVACALFAFIVGYIGSCIDKDDALIQELK